jgi:urate oxidase
MTGTTGGRAASGEIVLGQNSYGKSEIRLVKVRRSADFHELWDLTVDVALEGDFEAAHVEGDNSVRITGFPWDRIEVEGRGHPHSFIRGSGERKAEIGGDEGGERRVESGLDNVLVMKTTASGWENFYRDQYTTLPDTDDRILATSITASWSYGDETRLDYDSLWRGVRARILATFTDHYSPSVQNTLYRIGRAVLDEFPEVEKIHLSFPNKHHLLYDLERFGMENSNEIFPATSEPYGLIEGTVERAAL